MKIDISKQGFKQRLKNKKFKTEQGFEKWLNKNVKYIISFVDNRQDCLKWFVDERGEVLHANLQAKIWNGSIIDLSVLKVGKEIGVFDKHGKNSKFYDFIVKDIEIKK